jgi:hypothetical protein
MCLATFAGQVPWTPMTERQRNTRIAASRAARDRAILGLKDDLRERVASEWPGAVERGVAEGLVEFDEGGRVRIVGR